MENGSGEIREIKAKKILAVEGRDETSFFDKLLKHQRISDCQIEEVGGKNQFPTKLPALLRRPGFYRTDGSFGVTHLAIIRDRNGDDAFESITNILKKNELDPPKKEGQFSGSKLKIGIFIMPGQTIEGTMLEDLCLKTVEDHPAMGCVESIALCVSRLDNPPKNAQKSKAQAFLAAQPETVGSAGLGALKDYWDFDSSCLDELKAFLNNLR